MAKPTEELPTTLPHQILNDIIVMDYEVKSLMYADQFKLFPVVSSLGNKYVMILRHVDSNSFLRQCETNQVANSSLQVLVH